MSPPTSSTIARVVVNLSLDRAFDYHVPDNLHRAVRVGSKVKVPFGHGHRVGFVVAMPKKSAVPILKDIEQVLGESDMIPPQLVELGQWMAEYYCCARETAVHALLPSVVRGERASPKKQQTARLADDVNVADVLEGLSTRATRQIELIKVLSRMGPCSLARLDSQFKIPRTAVKALEAKGVLMIEETVIVRNPFAGEKILPNPPLPLTDEQRVAVDAITASLDGDGGKIFVLFGVTSSGKTEVYLQTISECLERGREAIVLVPEIALTPQTIERFRGRFGENISVLHSGLSDGERLDEWNRINEGEVAIVVGARSAVFAPFRKLGLIVVDEEHETSYKQDIAPRYHARDVAVMRAVREGATVVLGSATPSLESWHNVHQKKYTALTLSRRVDDQVMPTMEVVDMAAESMKTGRPQILSQRLIDTAAGALENGEQIMLFLNRRGYATCLQCLKCGFVAACDDCSMNNTYHRSVDQLVCHLCGMVRRAPDRCPECGDKDIRYGGLGTEKVEAVVKAVFPRARVLRMDSDTMTRKDSYRKALTSFRAGETDILVGTQMIAKGLHFPNVTVVGIIFADLSLNLPDFRAGERTFQLLVQVAGRAGRGEVPGRVIVQTYTPHHPAIQTALQQDFPRFSEEALAIRNELLLPPIVHMAMIRFRGENEGAVEREAEAVAARLAAAVPRGTRMSPPMASPIARKRAQYHFQLHLRTGNMTNLGRIIKKVLAGRKPAKGVAVSVDVDPYSML